MLLAKDFVVRGPVVPTVVPLPNSPPDRVQEVLLLDDQFRVALVLAAIDDDDA